MVFRASILEYIIIKNGTASTTLVDYTRNQKDNIEPLYDMGALEISREIKFLKNSGLIDLTPDEMTITSKGREFVDKGVFWDRLNALTYQLSGMNYQLLEMKSKQKTDKITMIISIVAIITSVLVAILK